MGVTPFSGPLDLNGMRLNSIDLADLSCLQTIDITKVNKLKEDRTYSISGDLIIITNIETSFILPRVVFINGHRYYPYVSASPVIEAPPIKQKETPLVKATKLSDSLALWLGALGSILAVVLMLLPQIKELIKLIWK